MLSEKLKYLLFSTCIYSTYLFPLQKERQCMQFSPTLAVRLRPAPRSAPRPSPPSAGKKPLSLWISLEFGISWKSRVFLLFGDVFLFFVYLCHIYDMYVFITKPKCLTRHFCNFQTICLEFVEVCSMCLQTGKYVRFETLPLIVLNGRDKERDRRHIFRHTLTATCDMGTFGPASQLEKREKRRNKMNAN